MNDEALIAELEGQREFARQCFAHNALGDQLDIISKKPERNILQLVESLTPVLKAHPVFGQGHIRFFASKQLNLNPLFASYGLLRAAAERDAPSAVTWLHRLLKVDYADLRMLAAVHGLEVHQSVTLNNGVRLLPFSDAPDSPQLRMLANRYQGWNGIIDGIVGPPAIAVFEMGSVKASADSGAGHRIGEDAYTALSDVARAFTLTDQAAPVIGVSWIDFIEAELTWAEFGVTWRGPSFEGSLRQPSLKVDDEGLEWATRYLRMEGKPRRTVDLALDRLNLARRRRLPGDQAIDGCICLEALLGDEGGGEITYKLQLRAALLLGQTLSERRDIRKAVCELYRLRSKLVHGRECKPKDTDTSWASRGLQICTQAVRTIVTMGSLPDFPTLELTS